MATANDIIDEAFQICGVHVTTQTQLDKAFITLNDMINQWSAERLMIYYIVKENFILVVGQSTYTIGSSGNFNTTRPQKILDAFIRDSGNVDHPVGVYMSLEEYNAISEKGADGRPTKLFYAQEYPLGKIYFDYEPEDAETLHLSSWKPLSEFATLATAVSLPKEYEKALKDNLAIYLAGRYQVPVDSFMLAQANFGKLLIGNINAPVVRPLRFSNELVRGALR